MNWLNRFWHGSLIWILSILLLIIGGVLLLILCMEGKFPIAIQALYLNQWDWFAVIIALISLSMGVVTAVSQKRTERNTMKITPESQQELLFDYVRHFYINLIVTKAIRAKLNGRFSEFYPSEEHFLKLKVDLASLHPAVFYNKLSYYRRIHELMLMFRNYNEEINVMVKHITTKDLFEDAKNRDFDTLEFKMDFLLGKVLQTIIDIWGGSEEKQKEYIFRVKEIIQSTLRSRNGDAKGKEYIQKARDYFADPNHEYFLPSFESDLKYGLNLLEKYFSKEEIDEIIYNTNIHIYVEMIGRNSKGSEKIFLIPFPK